MSSLAIQTTSQYKFGVLAILFASLLWGTTGTAASFADQLSPLAIGAFATGASGVIQAALSWRSIMHHFKQIMALKLLLAVSCLALSVYPLAFYTSMKLSGVTVGTVISIASAPFFTVFLECLFSKVKRFSIQWYVSFVFGLGGIIMLVAAKSDGAVEFNNISYLFGIVLGLVAGLSYAIYSWIAKRMIDSGIKSQAALGSIFGGGALLLLPSLLFTGENLFNNFNNTSVLVYMAIIPMCLGYLIYGYGLRYVDVSNACLLTLFEPVVAAVLAVVIVGEKVSISGWIGVVSIGICLILQALDSKASGQKS
ncbi:membrane protein [Photobacterium angustum]|uniref:EamA family transporter n=1 Tax=Photobacterium angustum TaxID=661 RepID=A0ABX5GYE4_PHOAN|nr:EamA family transporter [Photobacterium angustum]KJG40693.1 membrane protein [Photobacterium angustum]PSX03592.1 EamA family transporter [Photobacterium angustum]